MLFGSSLRHLRLAVSPTKCRTTSVWTNVPMGPPDPIFGVTEAFRRDERPDKINLGVGAFRDDNGKPYVLKAVRQAERLIIENSILNKEYLPIDGLVEFREAAAKLAYGDDCALLAGKQIAVAQSISGTGALRLGAVFLSRFLPSSGERTIFLPAPTWGNHLGIMRDAGLNIKRYRYIDQSMRMLDAQGMLEDLDAAPCGSAVLLHACAHNPTGVDPSIEQWRQVLEIVRRRRLIPFFDMAYQGFATGDIAADAAAVRMFAGELDSRRSPLCLAQSYAKNMGLYGERVGAFSVVASSAEEAARLTSQLRIVVRPMYSNPPTHGARVATLVMTNAELRAQWLQELSWMAGRISKMRQSLCEQLAACGSTLDWSHVVRQIGMFCYSGLRSEEVARLAKEHAVYMTADGRISIAGITPSNVSKLAMAINAVTKDMR